MFYEVGCQNWLVQLRYEIYNFVKCNYDIKLRSARKNCFIKIVDETFEILYLTVEFVRTYAVNVMNECL